MHSYRGGPSDANTGGWRLGGSLGKERHEKLVEEIVPQAIGAYLQIVPLRVEAPLGCIHDLQAHTTC
jgi:hypothetical protein